jgi:hypothetical protein
MRAVLHRIPPQIVVGIVSGYLFCATFDDALTLFSPAFGVHPAHPKNWLYLTPYILAPFVLLLSIALALGSRRAWILTQAYLVVRILLRVLMAVAVPMMLWHDSTHTPFLPPGVSGPALYVFIGVQLALNILISAVLFALLRRHDVEEFFRARQPLT